MIFNRKCRSFPPFPCILLRNEGKPRSEVGRRLAMAARAVAMNKTEETAVSTNNVCIITTFNFRMTALEMALSLAACTDKYTSRAPVLVRCAGQAPRMRLQMTKCMLQTHEQLSYGSVPTDCVCQPSAGAHCHTNSDTASQDHTILRECLWLQTGPVLAGCTVADNSKDGNPPNITLHFRTDLLKVSTERIERPLLRLWQVQRERSMVSDRGLLWLDHRGTP